MSVLCSQLVSAAPQRGPKKKKSVIAGLKSKLYKHRCIKIHVFVLLQEALQGVPGESDKRSLFGPGSALRRPRADPGLREIPGGHAERRERGGRRLPRSTAQGEIRRGNVNGSPVRWTDCSGPVCLYSWRFNHIFVFLPLTETDGGSSWRKSSSKQIKVPQQNVCNSRAVLKQDLWFAALSLRVLLSPSSSVIMMNNLFDLFL